MKVAIIGSGPIALGAAALLTAMGHQVKIVSPSGRGFDGLPVGAPMLFTGKIAASLMLNIAATMDAALEGADVVYLAVRANGVRTILDRVVASLRDRQSLVISGQLSFSALYAQRELAFRGRDNLVVALGSTVTTGRRLQPGLVNVSNIRAQVDLAAVPALRTGEGLALCEQMFGSHFFARQNLLAIELGNTKPLAHLAIALCNLTRIERGELWYQNQNITPAVGQLTEALDKERVAIAAALSAEVKTVQDHYHFSFGVNRDSVGAMAKVLAARGNGTAGPTSLLTRYITEDAPYGLYTVVLLGRLAGVPAKMHEAGLLLLEAACGSSFRAENDLVSLVGLDQMSKEAFLDAVNIGWPAARALRA